MRCRRRGVLLLVVLSMLVLFMLVGTAFLMSSSQQGKNAANSAKLNKVGNPPTKDLDSALMQVLRDSDNEHSAIRYHSLLRDLYGTDGFQGVVYQPSTLDLLTPVGQVTRFAAATADNASTPVREDLGPTLGQFIDIYVAALGYKATDTIDLRHVAKIDRNPVGQLQPYTLPLTKGYFNGCVLTITNGPAAGASSRILDYEYIADLAAANATTTATRLFRFRVLAFARADGQPLQINTAASRSPEILDLAGEPGGQSPATFLVNGRPFSGTGVGYNPLAVLGQPRLNAVERVQMGSDTDKALYPEVALTPNAAYFFACDPDTDPNHTDLRGVRIFGTGNFMNPKITTAMNAAQIAATLSQWRYPTFAGSGDANESYDAADFQNMALALQTVTPRAQGRVVQGTSASYVTLSATDPALDRNQFLRLDLEDLPIPSFHRPDLANYWFHRLLFTLTNPPFGMQPDEAALAILDPYPDGVLRTGLDPNVAALITAVKRKVSMRPLREDNPHFDGGNPLSVVTGLPANNLTVGTSPNLNIAIPYWEAVGPWDVDNDNDGVPDSVWVDIGNPVQEAEDGTRYKALVAYLIVDLDSRLNVNAHGLADDISPVNLAVSYDPITGAPMIGNAALNLAGKANSNGLPQGLGYGPAEISLRPVFPAPLDINGNPIAGNRREAFGLVDDYAAALAGRLNLDNDAINGRYGNDFNLDTSKLLITISPGTKKLATSPVAAPGTNYGFNATPAGEPAGSPRRYTGELATPNLAAQLKFFDYPWSINQPSAFGTPPDLKARYALGLDYGGQPVYEVANDFNPASPTNYFNLLANSPYELDLSSSQRRDSWGNIFPDSTTAFIATIDRSFGGGQNGLSDDAAFSSTDLEKVLRAWDADAGTLPSRLWDAVNAFDPLKLGNTQYGDPNRILNIEKTAFGINNPQPTDPEYLATAQQIAGINRRLVTTDSFDLPVVGGAVPNQAALAVGPDGAPGRAGVDDNNANGPDDVSEIGAPGSDDFKVIIGKEPAQATIADLLQYRIWTEARRFEMRRQGLTEGALAAMNNTDYAKFIGIVNTRAQAVLFQSPQLLSDLIAPEVIGGNRMDINRPFGDGRDDNGDGVVDDPLEAGDPFLDINGNGKWDNGEPFIDLIGDGGYTPPRDHMWSDLTASGTLGEQIGFDYTNGQVTRIHAIFVNKLKNIGGVRNLESQGRQVFARQLYCLTLLLVDENYIAPWDENDPQVMTWIESERKKLTMASPALSTPEADLIVKRKLTCRMIAQWAVNCVDMRDSDVIMTPFEYDENPWDGWGVWNDSWLGDVTDTSVVAKLSFLPLDGDPATDENKGEVIDWPNVPVAPNPNTKKLTTLPAADIPTHPLNQTRGLVWGAERPELLITETLAMHDRRTEDLPGAVAGDHDEMDGTSTDRYNDVDMDQRMRPRGSLFVELNNPQSPAGQLPAELYTRLDQTTNYSPTAVPNRQGVELGRMSNLADANGTLRNVASDPANEIRRSPVWRMIVVEDWPQVRNLDTVDDTRLDVKPKSMSPPKGYKNMETALMAWKPDAPVPPPYHMPDPDFDLAFNSAFVPTQVAGAVNTFNIDYPYIEREFYFTTDKSPLTNPTPSNPAGDWDYSSSRFKMRIPDRSIKIGGVASAVRARTQKFIPPSLDKTAPNQPVIAPVMPGRYAVVGSAGTVYSTLPGCYTTTIGRNGATGQKNTSDKQHLTALRDTRRIELVPNADPNVAQIVVGSNGGDPKDSLQPGLTPTPDAPTLEIGRDNELINRNNVEVNITDVDNNSLPDPDTDKDGIVDQGFYPAAVAIPIEDMNISEPPWGWGPREKQAAIEEDALNGTRPEPSYHFDPAGANGEGCYSGPPGSSSTYSYDKPFDTAPELLRTGTTPNYRTIHLQRLANPLVPWNPLPGQFKDSLGKDMYRPNLPINPYLTVDSASVNLTAFNGPSEEEHRMKPAGTYEKLLKSRPWLPNASKDVRDYLNNVLTGKQAWYFRSTERGAWARLNMAGQAATPKYSPPQRVTWAQEPAMMLFRRAAGSQEILDLLPERNMTMRASEVPPDVETNLKVTKSNHVNMVLEHSLGFGNETLGPLYDAQAAQSPAPPTRNAIGAPRPGRFVWDANFAVQVDSTNPWFAWNNRPYVSAEELLNVPAASQATMLRMYSTIDLNSTTPANGYGLAALGTVKVVPPGLNKTRWAIVQAPFGQMANMFAATALPVPLGAPTPTAFVQGVADVVRDPATGVPMLDANNSIQPYGGPNFYRILDFVQVPSRFVGTDTMLNAETFNDNPNVSNVLDDIASPSDPRYAFQPPFNKVSRERDPGRVNLNTVTGRRIPPTSTTAAQIWSEVYDGIMHRTHDANLAAGVLGQPGPAWRDVVLSRRGYVQIDAKSASVDKPAASPDVFELALNNNFPTFFANPFRSADAGDLVPVTQMMQYGVDASMLRKHPYDRGSDRKWGIGSFGDARDAGFGDDTLSVRSSGAIPSDNIGSTLVPSPTRDILPLFSEKRDTSFSDTDRNPYMMYQPMTRLGNLVTDRSNVFAVWVTIGYFEVEPAPNWNDPDDAKKLAIRQRFGGTNNDSDPATIAGLALYNRVYPDGYMLGRELGSDTGNIQRPRGFYIIDRTEPVGFKPGEDLNVEKAIRLRRRIE